MFAPSPSLQPSTDGTLQAMWAGVVLADASSGRVMFLNDAAKGLFGFAAGEACDVPVEDLLPGVEAAWREGPSSQRLMVANTRGGNRVVLGVSLFSYSRTPDAAPSLLAIVHGAADRPEPRPTANTFVSLASRLRARVRGEREAA